jgi:CBS domain-containing protein
MAREVISVRADDSVQKAAAVMLDHRISAVPVISDSGSLVGILSEGDLLRRVEIGTDRRRSSWLEFFVAPETRVAEFVKAHAVRVADVMIRQVVTATEDASLAAIATLLEQNGIKRVPIVRGEKLIGLVSRRDIVRAFAGAASRGPRQGSDKAIHAALLAQIQLLPLERPWLLTFIVSDGVVELWGPVESERERQAVRVAAEATPGVKAVNDNLCGIPVSTDA